MPEVDVQSPRQFKSPVQNIENGSLVCIATTCTLHSFELIFVQLCAASGKVVGSFGNDDGDAEDDSIFFFKKRYIYFPLECRNCVDLFSTHIGPKTPALSKYVMTAFNIPKEDTKN